MTPEMERRYDGLAAFAEWMDEQPAPDCSNRCFWVHCIHGCVLPCDHTELCYASRTQSPCVTASNKGTS